MTLPVVVTEEYHGAGGTLWSTLILDGVTTLRTMTSLSSLISRVSGELKYILMQLPGRMVCTSHVMNFCPQIYHHWSKLRFPLNQRIKDIRDFMSWLIEGRNQTLLLIPLYLLVCAHGNRNDSDFFVFYKKQKQRLQRWWKGPRRMDGPLWHYTRITHNLQYVNTKFLRYIVYSVYA